MDAILEATQIVNLKHVTSTGTSATGVHDSNHTVSDIYLVHSYQGQRPTLSVYDNKTQVGGGGNTMSFDATQNTMTIKFASTPSNISINEKVKIAGNSAADATLANVNGKSSQLLTLILLLTITINTTGLSFPDDGFTTTETDVYVLSDESESLEAFLKDQITCLRAHK